MRRYPEAIQVQVDYLAWARKQEAEVAALPDLAQAEAELVGTQKYLGALLDIRANPLELEAHLHSAELEAAMAQAHAFAAPLRGVATSRSPGSLPPRLSFLRAEPSGFVLTAVKQAEEGEGAIVRLYECEGRDARAHAPRDARLPGALQQVRVRCVTGQARGWAAS